MLEYLEKLMEERKWEEALSYAEQLLMTVEDDPRALLRLNVALLVCRHESGEYYGAQAIGQLCMKMASDLEAWDHLGTACLYLGTAYHRIGQYDDAIAVWFDFLNRLPMLVPRPNLEAAIRYNIGTAYLQMGKLDDARDALEQALAAANRADLRRFAHGIRHALIGVHIKMGHTSEVPRLLAQSLHYLHHHLNLQDETEFSRLWHFVIRAEFALSTGRCERAYRVALKGLSESSEQRLRIAFHMLLARIAQCRGKRDEAIQQAISARVEAIACRRYDLELEAADFMYQLVSQL